MTDPHELVGRTALVTGGTRGIGNGIADRLRARGARVSVAARSTLDRAGRVDIAVHNVGGSGQYEGGAPSLTDDDWQTALDANLLAAVRLDRAIIPAMVARGSAAIVHITSFQRRVPLPTSIPYGAAKAALTNYSKALSNELAPKGIRVNAVCPGYIETESAYRMAVETAEMNDISVDEARKRIMESIGAIPTGAPVRRPMSANSSRSWSPTAPPTSTVLST